MTYAFDTLGYAKRLREAGVSSEQAEAHAEAAREFIMGELVTRFDLERTQREVRQDIALSESRTEAAIGALRQEVENQRRDFEYMALRITVRLGGMIAIAVAILASIIKL